MLKFNPISGNFDDVGLDAWKYETGAYTALTPKRVGEMFLSVGNVDTTPYTVGGISPSVNFDSDYGGGAINIVGISSHGYGGFLDLGSLLFFNRSRGTQAAPTAIQNGDYIGGTIFGGYGGGDYQLTLTGMIAFAMDDWDVNQYVSLHWYLSGTSVFNTLATTASNYLTTCGYNWQFDQHLGIANGTAAVPLFNFTTVPTTGLYLDGVSNIGMTVNGRDSVVIGDDTGGDNVYIKIADTDRTVANTSSLITVDSTITIDYASCTMPIAFNFNPTMIFAQNSYGFSAGLGFWMRPKIQNSSGSTRTVGPFLGVGVQPNYQANGGTMTVGYAIDYAASPTMDVINSGTLNVTSHANFWAQGGAIGTSATVTTRFGYLHKESGAITGTLTGTAAFCSAFMLGTNKTHFLIGTDTVPTGSWGIYQSSTETNFFSGDINFVKEAARIIQMTDTTTAATAGAALSIIGAAGSNTTSGTGGAINVTSGAGRAGNAGGGALNLTAGVGVGVSGGGHVNITGGAALTGGSVIINGGNGVADGNIRLGATDGMVQVGHSATPTAMMHIKGRVAATTTLEVDNVAIVASVAQFKDNGTLVWDIVNGGDLTAGEGINIVLGTTTGTKIGTATTQKLGFFNATPIVQPTALTTQSTSITHTAPGTPDYAIQDLAAGGFGFVTKDEGNTVLSVILNLQTRVAELEAKLSAAGGGVGIIA